MVMVESTGVTNIINVYHDGSEDSMVALELICRTASAASLSSNEINQACAQWHAHVASSTYGRKARRILA